MVGQCDHRHEYGDWGSCKERAWDWDGTQREAVKGYSSNRLKLTRSVYYHLERDSRKDEAVVFIFIFATVGLLGWSLIRPWVLKWVEACILPIWQQSYKSAAESFSMDANMYRRVRGKDGAIYPWPTLPKAHPPRE